MEAARPAANQLRWHQHVPLVAAVETFFGVGAP
jgi:hypothetical protein